MREIIHQRRRPDGGERRNAARYQIRLEVRGAFPFGDAKGHKRSNDEETATMMIKCVHTITVA